MTNWRYTETFNSGLKFTPQLCAGMVFKNTYNRSLIGCTVIKTERMSVSLYNVTVKNANGDIVERLIDRQEPHTIAPTVNFDSAWGL